MFIAAGLIAQRPFTAYGTIREAVEATQCGAFGYWVKPIEREELVGQVQRAAPLIAGIFVSSGSTPRNCHRFDLGHIVDGYQHRSGNVV
jgi:ActR/RegA family two-component response regulator